MKKFFATAIVAAMLCVSFSIVSFNVNVNVSAEAVTGPFVLKSDGYPAYIYEVDQSMEEPPDNFMTFSLGPLAQTFTLPAEGEIRKVSIYTANPMVGGGGGLQVEIAPNLGGAPYQTAMVDELDVPDGDWLDVIWPGPFVLTPGQYTIQITPYGGFNCEWHYKFGDPYPTIFGDGWYLDGVWNPLPPAGGDFNFIVYKSLGNGLEKVAWHGDGTVAIAVDGITANFYQFHRTTEQWTLIDEFDANGVAHDIVYDPINYLFYAVGQDGAGHATAWIYDYDGSMFWPCASTATQGVFYGVEYAAPASGKCFVAVGTTIGGVPDAAIIYWYETDFWLVEGYSGSDPTEDVLYDVAWDYAGGSYWIVGADSGGPFGVVYYLPDVGTGAQDMAAVYGWGVQISLLKAVDWCPLGPTSYALMVGDGSLGNVYQKFNDANPPNPLSFSSEIFYDVDWLPDGSMAYIVGDDGGSNGAVYHHHFNMNPSTAGVVPMCDYLPPGTGILRGVAVKGPSSPSSAIILGAGGGIGAFPQASDTSTRITINAAFPHIFELQMWKTSTWAPGPGPSTLNTQIDPDDNYTFYIQGNYSVDSVDHWLDLDFAVYGWYDDGNVPPLSVPFDPIWNPAEENYRTRQFNVSVLSDVGTNEYPVGPPNEFRYHSHYYYDLDGPLPGIMYGLYINVTMDKQTWAADGLMTPPPLLGQLFDKNNQWNNVGTWDFTFALFDRNFVGARNESYEEFGVKQAVSITASGNPSGNAPPGSVNVPLATPSTIVYSSNTEYFVNVSLATDLRLNGVSLIDTITADNIAVRNMHVNASYVYSDITGADYPDGRTFLAAGPLNALCVWGNSTTILNMPRPWNGTQTAGVWHTDFNSLGVNDFTQVFWIASVPVGTTEGVYWATITVSIEDN